MPYRAVPASGQIVTQMEKKNRDKYFVYILRTSRNTLYVGQTNDLEKRFKAHQGKIKGGAKYTRAFGVSAIVYSESFETRSEAMKREYELKKLSHKEKDALVGLVQ